jgi:hypothetical protein
MTQHDATYCSIERRHTRSIPSLAPVGNCSTPSVAQAHATRGRSANQSGRKRVKLYLQGNLCMGFETGSDATEMSCPCQERSRNPWVACRNSDLARHREVKNEGGTGRKASEDQRKAVRALHGSSAHVQLASSALCRRNVELLHPDLRRQIATLTSTEYKCQVGWRTESLTAHFASSFQQPNTISD